MLVSKDLKVERMEPNNLIALKKELDEIKKMISDLERKVMDLQNYYVVPMSRVIESMRKRR